VRKELLTSDQWTSTSHCAGTVGQIWGTGKILMYF